MNKVHNSISPQTIKHIYRSGVIFFALAIIGFYSLQNQPNHIGGAISFPKACWLGLAIFYWYFIPIILLLDKRSHNGNGYFYKGIGVFFASMLLRAFLELYLMYGNQAWHYEYGIAHNVLSVIILMAVIVSVKKTPDTPLPLKITLYILLLMFCAEIYFASYMVFVVKDGHQAVTWFIDNSAQHNLNNAITSIIVMLLIVWQIIFYEKWIKQ
ncbi:MAG: hypothetical protein KGV56_03230 [Gammaproteobacteria bacterium]|nr:hypothetical protein [Gammaproteobacteria bacterium]